jgi:phosphoribosylformylglycinamidine cyclo-ligase
MGNDKNDLEEGMTYRDAGVDIKKADELVGKIKTIAATTFNAGVIGGIGGFGGLFRLMPYIKGMKDPVLVSSTDGVGTKLKIAIMMNKHDTVGIDLVAMCVNDIIVQGARPINFLDYLATGKLDTGVAEKIIKGIAAGCIEAGCALIGGETAEMPGFYQDGEYDAAGFAVGVVDFDKKIDGSTIKVGNKLIGIASSGLHSNGFSLVRKIVFDRLHLPVDTYIEELGCTIGEELLRPTKIYVRAIQSLINSVNVNGLIHITGGGSDNIIRVLPNGLGAVVKAGSWPVPPIFSFLQRKGNVETAEMRRVFNNGIGMIAIVEEQDAKNTISTINKSGEKAYEIGYVCESKELSDGKRLAYIDE